MQEQEHVTPKEGRVDTLRLAMSLKYGFSSRDITEIEGSLDVMNPEDVARLKILADIFFITDVKRQTAKLKADEGDPRFNKVSDNITNAFIIEENEWPEDKLNLLEEVCNGIKGASVEFFTYDPTPENPQNRKRYGRITYIENGRRVDHSGVWREFENKYNKK